MFLQMFAGAVVGAMVGVLCIRWIDHRLRRTVIEGTDGRVLPPIKSASLPVINAVAEPTTGGGLGYPFARVGEETLRILPAGREYHVLWRAGDELVAKLVVETEEHAELLYQWLSQRIGRAADLLAAAEHAGSEPVLLLRFRDRRRRRDVALVQRGELHKVVEIVRGKLRSAAFVAGGIEGQELFVVFAHPPGADLDESPLAEPGAGPQSLVVGADDDPGLEVDPIDDELEAIAPDWDRVFR